jgi:ribosomal protein S18 acetylase RimI-like enzyme
MGTTMTEWRVRDDATNDEVRPLLEQDRIWNCFALADMLPPFRAYTRFATAARPGEPASAVLLIVQHPDFTTISPYGDVGGVAAILSRAALPSVALVQTAAAHRELLEDVYQPAPAWREMRRMAVTHSTFVPQAATLDVARLGMSDFAEICDLYQHAPESIFRQDLLDQDSFFGLRANGCLVAIAGTHVLAEPLGIAVVGNVLTHPDERGKGYAGMVTSALVTHLSARGCGDVVLNVFEANAPAIAVYRRLGFETHEHLWSGQAERRQKASR